VFLLLHPFAPFITEELWHKLGYGDEESFIQNINPGNGTQLLDALKSQGVVPDQEASQWIGKFRQFVSQARALKAERNLASKKDVTFYFTADTEARVYIENYADKFRRLVGAASISFKDSVADNMPATVTELGTLYIDLASAVDVDAEKERMKKEIEKLGKMMSSTMGKLKNKSFVDKAPAAVVDGAKKQLADNKDKLDELRRLMAGLN